VESFGIPAANVQSPTFTLVREYGSTRKIFHADLYRLENEEEIFEAGIFDLLTGDDLVLVEWADKLTKYYPEPSVEIRFSHGAEGGRVIEVL